MLKPPWYQDPIEQTAFNAYVFDLEERVREGIATGNVDLSGLNELDRDYVIKQLEKELS